MQPLNGGLRKAHARVDGSGTSTPRTMPPSIAFQSSLPRLGSTLFSNIVGQNPAFHVTPTSGLLNLLYVARGQFSRGVEFKAQESHEMERAMRPPSPTNPGCSIKAAAGGCTTPF